LGSNFIVTTIIFNYIFLTIANYVYFLLDLFYTLTTPICLISHFEICLGVKILVYFHCRITKPKHFNLLPPNIRKQTTFFKHKFVLHSTIK
jgi:hypothetical protein